MVWIILTDSNRCKIYHYEKSSRQLILIKEINHPENKLKNSELVSDKPGHYKTRETARGTYAPHMEAKDAKIDDFAREIGYVLNQGRTNHQYEKLIVIAPSHMGGLLYSHLNKHVSDCIVGNIQKDLLHVADHELKIIIENHIKKV